MATNWVLLKENQDIIIKGTNNIANNVVIQITNKLDINLRLIALKYKNNQITYNTQEFDIKPKNSVEFDAFNHKQEAIKLYDERSSDNNNCSFQYLKNNEDFVIEFSLEPLIQQGGGKKKQTVRKGSLESFTVKELKAKAAERKPKINVSGLNKNEIIAKLRGRKVKA